MSHTFHCDHYCHTINYMLHLLNFSHTVSVVAVLVSQSLWSGATVRVVIHVIMYHKYQFPGQSPSTRPVHSPCLTCELSVTKLLTHATLVLVVHSNVTFQLLFPSETITIDSLDEGVEFSLQFGSERGWIPITLTILRGITGRDDFILIGTEDTEGNVLIRGYLPEQNELIRGVNTRYSVTVCDFEDSVDSVQFRWLETGRILTESPVRDAWNLDNVLITYQDEDNEYFVLFDGSK